MQSKKKGLAKTGVGATLLVALFVGCSHASGDGAASANPSAVESAVGSSGVMACTDVAGQLISGRLTTAEPTMNGRFFPHGFTSPPPPSTRDVAPTCDNPLAMPAVELGGAIHYQSYTFANGGDGAACISVRLVRGFIKNGPIIDAIEEFETIAYLDSFDPSDITKNYIADFFGLDGIAGDTAELSFEVPAHARFVVVVSGGEIPPQDVLPDQSALFVLYDLGVTNCRGGNGSSSGGTGGEGSDAGGGNAMTW